MMITPNTLIETSQLPGNVVRSVHYVKIGLIIIVNFREAVKELEIHSIICFFSGPNWLKVS